MSWVDETGRHEGYVTAVLADGDEPAVGPDGARMPWWSYNGADGPLAVAVKGACGCGWRGEASHAVDFGDDEKTEGYAAGSGPYADWEQHSIVAEGVVPYDVQQLLGMLQRRIDELAESQPLRAVRVAARIEGMTPIYSAAAAQGAARALIGWDTIGREFGLSPEAARDRFALFYDPADPADPSDPLGPLGPLD